ncbi:MAG: phosphoglucosamine mutase [Thermodesulfobacteriota bacterium]|nr:phosphoglucosamine mutase [Thermodesulfobacteriota bacterium]
MARLFGTDGVRGEANRHPVDGVTAFLIGQAITHLLRKPGYNPRLVVGKDTRISGHMLESSLDAGITSMGGIPCLVGVLPTPAIALYTKNMHADAGIMISASHNPYQDNGIKFFAADGFKLSDDQEQSIEDLILNGRLSEMVPHARRMGGTASIEDVSGAYIDFLKGTLPRGLLMKGTKIVIDPANGAAYKVAPNAFTELGADVKVIHNSPDGVNINDNCGSQYTQDLQRAVVETDADAGLALDGDGDRLIAVDEKGGRITGDQILIICAKMLMDEGKLRNNLIVSTVMSNLGLKIACKKYGFIHHESRVGDRYVVQDMQRLDAVIGGEESGHVVFLNHHTTGDGTLAGIQLIASMLKAEKPLSELAAMMEIFPQHIVNVKVKNKPDISTIPRVVKAIKQVEAELGDRGRVLVRYSGTQDLCRVMVEGPTDGLTIEYCGQIADVIKTSLA